MKTLSKKAKGAIIGSVAGVIALAVGIGVWQPWNEPEGESKKPPVEQLPQHTQEEEKLTLTVAGEEIPCTLYEGDGWTIYLPEGWDAAGSTLWPERTGKPKVCLTVSETTFEEDYPGTFASVWNPSADHWGRTFYTGEGKPHWEVSHWAGEEDFGIYDKLFTAVARTFQVEGDRPFAKMQIALEPDWQIAGEQTVLWLDKDGVPLEDYFNDAVESRMLSWGQTLRDYFTGRYKLTDTPVWRGGYHLGPERYIDVFATSVAYEIVPGREGEKIYQDGMLVKDGWQREWGALFLAVTHDGSQILETKPLWAADEIVPGYPNFLSALNAPEDRELSPEELRAWVDWFNLPENNGLLRFAYDDSRDPEQIAPFLELLFYDLSVEPITEEDLRMLAEAGMSLEFDELRLPTDYMLDYLTEKLDMGRAQAEKVLQEASPGAGIYLPEAGAWYLIHSDTEMRSYTFDSGVETPDGTVILRYPNEFVRTQEGDGEGGYVALFDAEMEVTLRPDPKREGGWYVVSNKLVQ